MLDLADETHKQEAPRGHGSHQALSADGLDGVDTHTALNGAFAACQARGGACFQHGVVRGGAGCMICFLTTQGRYGEWVSWACSGEGSQKPWQGSFFQILVCSKAESCTNSPHCYKNMHCLRAWAPWPAAAAPAALPAVGLTPDLLRSPANS